MAGSATATDRPPLRVVIADDEDEMRLMLRLRLQQMDHVEVVGEARTGREAVTAVRNQRPNALILDVGMPELDGLAVIDVIREECRVAPDELRIVVYTAGVNDELKQRALASGADAYIDKSAHWNVVADALRTATPKPPTRRGPMVARRWFDIALAAAAALCVAFAAQQFVLTRDALTALALALCVGTAYRVPIHTLRGTVGRGTAHVDAHVNIAGLALMSSPAFVIGATCGFVLALLSRRLPARRVITGACRYAVTAYAQAWVAGYLVGRGWTAVASAVAGSVVMVVVNFLLYDAGAFLDRAPFAALRTARFCAVVWLAAAPIGVAAALLGERSPAALTLMVAPWIVTLGASALFLRVERERRLFDELLNAATRSQHADSIAEVEGIVTSVASNLLDGADVRIVSSPVDDGRWCSVPIEVDGARRWLVAGVDGDVESARGVLEPVSTVAAALLANAHKSHQQRTSSITDELTDLANTRGLHAALERIVAQHERVGTTAAVVFIDLDDFKVVNDTLGHEAGDAVLRSFADRLRATIRPYDLAARIGGDEFVVVLGATPDDAAVASAVDRIRRIAERPHPVGDRQVTLGASVGVAVFPATSSSPAELLRHADDAMYEEKRIRKELARTTF